MFNSSCLHRSFLNVTVKKYENRPTFTEVIEKIKVSYSTTYYVALPNFTAVGEIVVRGYVWRFAGKLGLCTKSLFISETVGLHDSYCGSQVVLGIRSCHAMDSKSALATRVINIHSARADVGQCQKQMA